MCPSSSPKPVHKTHGQQGGKFGQTAVIDGGTALRVQFGAREEQVASSSATKTVENKNPIAD